MEKIIVKIESDIKEMSMSYFAKQKENMEEPEVYLKNREFEPIRQLAHKMHGTGSSYGFERITEIGKAMNISAKDENEILIRQQIDILNNYINRYINRVEIIWIKEK